MDKTNASKSQQELLLLEALQEIPEARQTDLAMKIGVSVGTVNWHLKRLTGKGLIKVKQIGRWRWQYLLTPKGIAEKTKLTAAYVQNSMMLYRETRARVQDLLQEVRLAGFEHVRLSGEGELLEVCRLTCLEQRIKIVPEHLRDVPLLKQSGLHIFLEWPKNLDRFIKQSEANSPDEMTKQSPMTKVL